MSAFWITACGIVMLSVCAVTSDLCRDTWVGHVGREDFLSLSCAKCYVQVFLDEKPLTIMWPPTPPFPLVYRFMPNITYAADAFENDSVVCQLTLTEAECQRWRQCCSNAQKCCDNMPPDNSYMNDSSTCPSTWDGVACWPATQSGDEAKQSCPSYYQSAGSTGNAVVRRYCTINGTWYLDPHRQAETTDYTACFDSTDTTKILKVSLLIDAVGHSISILSLTLSILIISCSRALRRDFLSRDSLRLHMNLFIAMLGLSVATLAFCYIFYDGVIHPADAIYLQNPVWCRALYTLTTYFRGTAYMAMFSEGLFLYRRISRMMRVNVREPTAHLFVITWALPVLTTSAYVATRVALHMDERCWIAEGFSALELIYMVPNIISLACNICFLLGIEYNLFTTMKGDSTSSDRRSKVLRHALRATLSLVPVFGIQFLFIVYRPAHWPPYEIMAALLTSTQGFVVSIVYCFSTKEVRQELFSCCSQRAEQSVFCACFRPCFKGRHAINYDMSKSQTARSFVADTETNIRQVTPKANIPHKGITQNCIEEETPLNNSKNQTQNNGIVVDGSKTDPNDNQPTADVYRCELSEGTRCKTEEKTNLIEAETVEN